MSVMPLTISCLSLLLFVLLCSTRIPATAGQAYHFSKGWSAGKRGPDTVALRSPAASSRATNSDTVSKQLGHLLAKYLVTRSSSTCQVQPQVQRIITDLIQVGSDGLIRVFSLGIRYRTPRRSQRLKVRNFKTVLSCRETVQEYHNQPLLPALKSTELEILSFES